MTDSSGWCVHGDISTDHQSASRIELSGLGQNLFDFSNFDMTPPIDSFINPYTHPQVGVSPQIITLQTELNYLDYIKIYLISSDLT